MPRPSNTTLAASMQAEYQRLLAQASEHRRDAVHYLVEEAIPDLADHERTHIDRLLVAQASTKPLSATAEWITQAILSRREAANASK